MVSPGLTAIIRSLPHAVTATMPSSVTPMPKWANAVPHTERGRPIARIKVARIGKPQNHGALGNVGHRAGHDEYRDADAERRQHRAAVLDGKGRGHGDGGKHCRGEQALRRADDIAALPAEQRPK